MNNIFDLRNIQVIQNGDANNYRTGGLYYFGETGINVPTIFPLILVLGKGIDAAQICISYKTRLIYFRTNVNNVWNQWRSFNLSSIG